MRAIVFAFIFLLTAAPVAVTEQAATAQQQSVAALADAPPPPTPEALAAARSLNRAVLIDSRIFDEGLDYALEQEMPALRAEIEQSPFYASLNAAHRRAVMDFFANALPAMAREAISALLPEIVEDTAAETAGMFSEDELRDIEAFMRTQAARDVMITAMRAGVTSDRRDDDIHLTPAQQAASAAFEATPSGQVFTQNSDAYFKLLTDALERRMARLSVDLRMRAMQQLCTALGSECPPALRNQFEPT
jgi:hypothetical protein